MRAMCGPAAICACNRRNITGMLRSAWVLCLVLVAGCSTYSARNVSLRPDLAAARYESALKTIEENRKGKDLLLYYLEKGLVLHYADRWQESNDIFQLAEDLAADLYTKSISEGVFSLITSDNTISYRATPFEMSMIPYYRALNYVYLGQKEEALVEARKASLYLSQYADMSLSGDSDDKEQQDELELLRNNAFLHYFSGMLYEWDGAINDAFIAYRHAADAYAFATGKLAVAPPPWLARDLTRTAEQLGFYEELERLRDQYPDLFAAEREENPAAAGSVAEGRPDADPAPALGEVVLLLELGYNAHKEQLELNVPILKDDDYADYDDWAESLVLRTRPGWRAGKLKIDYWLRVAVPELVSDRPEVQAARVSAGLAGAHAVTATVEDLEGRSFLIFNRAYGGMLLKTFARGLAKYAAKAKADDQGWFAGALANLLGAATETADTRSWLTLPNQIAMARLRLPSGEHDLRVDLLDGAGRVVGTETVTGVVVRAGDWRFISRRVF